MAGWQIALIVVAVGAAGALVYIRMRGRSEGKAPPHATPAGIETPSPTSTEPNQ